MYTVRPGLGDTTETLPSGKSITFDSDGNWVQGFGCWMMGTLGGLVNQNCVPPTSAELAQAIGMSDIGPNASPALATQVLADQQALIQADCANNSALCNSQVDAASAVETAAGQVAQPVVNLASGIFQTVSDIGNALKCGLFQTAKQQDDGSYVCGTNWVLWGGIGLVAACGLVVLSQGSARRYGR